MIFVTIFHFVLQMGANVFKKSFYLSVPEKHCLSVLVNKRLSEATTLALQPISITSLALLSSALFNDLGIYDCDVM